MKPFFKYKVDCEVERENFDHSVWAAKIKKFALQKGDTETMNGTGTTARFDGGELWYVYRKEMRIMVNGKHVETWTRQADVYKCTKFDKFIVTWELSPTQGKGVGGAVAGGTGGYGGGVKGSDWGYAGNKGISAAPCRMQPENELPSILPTTKWQDIVPARSMLEELRQNKLILAKIPDIDIIANDVELKAVELRFDNQSKELAKLMDDDELHGVLVYTHDLGKDKKDGNFYYEENKDLRRRDLASRGEMMKTFGVHVYYTLLALGKLPDYSGVVYRGSPDADVAAEYTEGRTIQWGAWTSTTTLLDAAKGFGQSRLIFIIKIKTGKDIGSLSFFRTENEILLTPNHRFIVTKPPYKEGGITFVELQEMNGPDYIS